ncbi:hypothetical protein [Agrococcus carbonis]|jgi:hypothetical protein|uniref:Uncharacterized protein n=1 Tax=Agrococcus carbonis TaxID=684552 RepID=A0A1H1T606_9MICO|nr:hypothetical protein [Agrococcus carbonis]SDS55563.1 hypothetical protein SAMN04489719_2586 [Agrococcus carbonis]
MQIGTRWPVGGEPPAAVPVAMRAAIADEERTLVELGADTAAWRWTLTFLEGQPVVELDDGTTIRLDGDDVLVTREQP